MKDSRVSWKSHSEEAKRTWGRSEPCNVLVEECARQREPHVAKAMDWDCACVRQEWKACWMAGVKAVE